MSPVGFAAYFNTDKHTDLKIHCHGEVFKAHKVVLCARSEYFQKACENGFKEAGSDTIELHDDDPLIVEAMLRYLYTEIYDISHVLKFNSTSTAMQIHLAMTSIADKYDLVPLLHRAGTTLFSEIDAGTISILEVTKNLSLAYELLQSNRQVSIYSRLMQRVIRSYTLTLSLSGDSQSDDLAPRYMPLHHIPANAGIHAQSRAVHELQVAAMSRPQVAEEIVGRLCHASSIGAVHWDAGEFLTGDESIPCTSGCKRSRTMDRGGFEYIRYGNTETLCSHCLLKQTQAAWAANDHA